MTKRAASSLFFALDFIVCVNRLHSAHVFFFFFFEPISKDVKHLCCSFYHEWNVYKYMKIVIDLLSVNSDVNVQLCKFVNGVFCCFFFFFRSLFRRYYEMCVNVITSLRTQFSTHSIFAWETYNICVHTVCSICYSLHFAYLLSTLCVIHFTWIFRQWRTMQIFVRYQIDGQILS